MVACVVTVEQGDVALLPQGQWRRGGGELHPAKDPFYLDHVVIQEDLTQGEAVRHFAVHIQTGVSGRLVTVYEGRNIGHKAICRLPLLVCRKVVVEITESDRPAQLRNVTLHNTTGLAHQHC